MYCPDCGGPLECYEGEHCCPDCVPSEVEREAAQALAEALALRAAEAEAVAAGEGPDYDELPF
jgi:hypothetical protein